MIKIAENNDNPTNPGLSESNLSGPRGSVTHLDADGGISPPERLVLDAVGHAVIVTDLNGKITFWNAAAETVYGWDVLTAFYCCRLRHKLRPSPVRVPYVR